MRKRTPTRAVSLPPRVVLLGALAYAALFCLLTFWKYRYYLYLDYDLAAWNQVLWNTLHGRFFYFSIRDITWFYHLPLILLPLLPLYALVQHPAFLLALLSFGLAAGAWPMYALAARESGPRWGVFWALVYLLYPPVAHINLFEFHVDGLSIPFWLGAMHAYRRNRFRVFFACLVLALACKELFLIPAAMFGVYAWIQRRKGAWVAAPLLLASAWYLLGVKVITPWLVRAELPYGVFFGDWTALWPEKLAYLSDLFTPLLWMNLVSPGAMLIALPALALHLASDFPGLTSIETHYAAQLVPFILIAAVSGLRRALEACKPASTRRIASRIAAASIVAVCLVQHPVRRLVPLLAASFVDPLVPVRDAMIAAVPPAAPCVATFTFLSRLSNRAHLFSLHQIILGKDPYTGAPSMPAVAPDYALLDLNDPMTFRVFAFPDGLRRMRRYFQAEAWGVRQAVGPLLLLQRGAPSQRTLVAPVEVAIATAPLGVFDGALEWLGARCELEHSASGLLLRTTLRWRLAQPGGKYALDLTVAGPSGETVAWLRQDVGYELHPTASRSGRGRSTCVCGS
jgi:uncharacterized membrane protein